MRIKCLDPILANQIAAGEVIDRPSAVLKELLENALDANATDVYVEFEGGGIRKISVRDNGDGIAPEDLPLAFLRHATSKLDSIRDLFELQTLGFRGEALAAMSSVAKVRIASKLKESTQAFMIESLGGQMSPVLPFAHPAGTTVEVSDLFFNTPVRRRFLRSEKTEHQQLEEVFKRIVLSHFNVAFHLKIFPVQKTYPKADSIAAQKMRVANILGRKFVEHSTYISVERLGLRLWGWVGLKECAKKQADSQFFYVNQRIVKDKLLNHAIKSSYMQLCPLPEGMHPSYVLFLDVAPSQIDVNVHPTKLEVRFSESRLVHDFLFFALTAAFENTQIALSFPVASPLMVLPAVETKAEMAPKRSAPHYHLFQKGDALFIIDLKRAFQPMMVALFKNKIAADESIVKPLLFPKEMALYPQEDELVKKHTPLLQQLGIQFQIQKDTLFFLTVPIGADINELPDFLRLLFRETYSFDEAVFALFSKNSTSLLDITTQDQLHQCLENWPYLEQSGFAYPISLASLADFFLKAPTLVV